MKRIMIVSALFVFSCSAMVSQEREKRAKRDYLRGLTEQQRRVAGAMHSKKGGVPSEGTVRIARAITADGFLDEVKGKPRAPRSRSSTLSAIFAPRSTTSSNEAKKSQKGHKRVPSNSLDENQLAANVAAVVIPDTSEDLYQALQDRLKKDSVALRLLQQLLTHYVLKRSVRPVPRPHRRTLQRSESSTYTLRLRQLAERVEVAEATAREAQGAAASSAFEKAGEGDDTDLDRMLTDLALFADAPSTLESANQSPLYTEDQ